MSQRKWHGEEEVKMSGSEYDLRVGNDLQAQAGAVGRGGEKKALPRVWVHFLRPSSLNPFPLPTSSKRQEQASLLCRQTLQVHEGKKTGSFVPFPSSTSACP